MPDSALSSQSLDALLKNRERFTAFVRKHVHDPNDAEDIVQSAFARTVEKGESIRGDESIVAWFYRVLRNAIIDYYRRSDVRARGNEQYGKELERLQPVLDPSDRQELCQCLWPVMEDLKPEYREALKQVDLEEHSLAELAHSAAISENNATVRLHRARRALKKKVESTCGACATHGCLNCTCGKHS
jgi:RNA polymerase sigma-70 factor (ECF subfamily)